MADDRRGVVLATGADELHNYFRHRLHNQGLEVVAVVRHVAGRVLLGAALVRFGRLCCRGDCIKSKIVNARTRL